MQHRMFTCIYFVVISSSVYFGTCQAVECYDCTNMNGTGIEDCTEPFPNPVPLTNITITECEKYCVKSITTQSVTNANGVKQDQFYGTSRYCRAQCLEVCYRAGPGLETCTYCCEGDLCNGAGPGPSCTLQTLFLLVYPVLTWMGFFT